MLNASIKSDGEPKPAEHYVQPDIAIRMKISRKLGGNVNRFQK